MKIKIISFPKTNSLESIYFFQIHVKDGHGIIRIVKFLVISIFIVFILSIGYISFFKNKKSEINEKSFDFLTNQKSV